MDLKETVFSLSKVNGVSGCETAAAEYAEKLLREYTDNVKITSGGVIADICPPKPGKPKIVLDAHIDCVGFVITSVENGFAKVSDVGSIDTRMLAAQRVTVHEKKPVRGVICTIPPHLSKKDSRAPNISEIYIDLRGGEEFVSPGDFVSFDTLPASLIGIRVAGKALDNRSGITAVLYALDITDIASLECGLTVVFPFQEEVGLRGAGVCAYETCPDIAVAVDVSFAYSEGENRFECGEMGKGCMIGFSPVLDKELSLKLAETAERLDIPYQREVMNDSTGTDADKYSVSRSGVKTATLSIPLKYMHTPAEVIDLSDIINTGRLIAAFIKEAGK